MIIVGVAAAIVIAVLAGVIVYLVHGMQQMQNVQEEEKEERIVLVKEDNVKEVIKEMEKEKEEKVPVGAYEVSMNTEWIFADGAAVSDNAFVENSEANTNMVYFVVTIDGNEEVYRSPYMEVGSYLEGIQLDKVLEKGEYPAVITYYLVDDEFHDLSWVSMTMRIVVES